MITQTIKELLQAKKLPMGYYLYMFRDGDTIFYIGQSTDPLKRFKRHVQDNTTIAAVINANLPDSLQWEYVLILLDECSPMVEKHQNVFYSFFTERLEQMKPYGNLHDVGLVDIAERALIDFYQPYLNIMEVSYTNNLPDKYKRSSFNEASTSTYLDL